MRHSSVRLLLALVCLAAVTASYPQSAAPTHVQGVIIRGVGPIQMTVSDMDRAVDFYSRVLAFEKTSDTEVYGDEIEQLFGVFGARIRLVHMQLGSESIELAQFLAPRGRPIPLDSRSNDLWFQHVAIIVSDMDRAYAILRRNKVEHASSGPQLLPDWNKNAGGIRAFYFKDPDDHPLEILQFPPDKGDPKWHQTSDRLFLGIDHTAIAVADTDSSLKFYHDLLGFRVVGESENYGTEQEHLNNVFGAHLRITALRAQAGPGIELLEYVSPRDGRPFPADEHANDLVHRATILLTDNADTVAQQLLTTKAKFVSSGVVSTHMNSLEFRKAFQLRDPDGHPIEVAAQ
jgi:catechol 2,3-dioxygenase-like lactoylglutathione lyase family enzyme